MAKKIDQHKFRSSRYDWNSWLDGGIWVLTQGEDFDVEMSTMRSTVLGAGYRRSLKVRTSLDMEKKTITIQAYKEGK